MAIVRYDPFQEIMKVQSDMDKIWGNNWGILSSASDNLPMDMYEENGQLIAEFNLPNFKRNEIKVSSDNGILEVMAEHHEKSEDKSRRRYYHRENSTHIVRRVPLPEGVKVDKTKASYKDGVLKITMPATKPALPQEIAVS